jgi:LPPG:FO 2-phospho-L-lactate transferase
LRETSAPVVIVSPVVGGTAVKGPMAKIMGELGLEVTHAAIADHYAGLVDGLMIDCPDDGIAGDVVIAVENTMMRTLDDRIALARCVLEFADQLALGRDISRERIA